jgi:cytochrome P450
VTNDFFIDPWLERGNLDKFSTSRLVSALLIQTLFDVTLSDPQQRLLAQFVDSKTQADGSQNSACCADPGGADSFHASSELLEALRETGALDELRDAFSACTETPISDVDDAPAAAVLELVVRQVVSGTSHLAHSVLARLAADDEVHALFLTNPTAFCNEVARLEPAVHTINAVLIQDTQLNVMGEEWILPRGVDHCAVIYPANTDPKVWGRKARCSSCPSLFSSQPSLATIHSIS